MSGTIGHVDTGVNHTAPSSQGAYVLIGGRGDDDHKLPSECNLSNGATHQKKYSRERRYAI